MKKSSTFTALIAASILCVAVVSVVHSQDAQPQQPGAATQPPAGSAPPATAPGALPGAAPAAASAAIDQQQVSYALGRQFGMNLKKNEIAVDLNALVAGIGDVMTGAQPRFTDEQLGATMQRFMQEMQQKAVARAQQQVARNKQMETAFLAKNQTQPGVETTASGLQYKVIKSGNGPSPTAADMVRCDYRGVLLDGTEFDSAQLHGGPQEFRVGEVIPGWTEALQKMKVGDKWELYVPAVLAYDMMPPEGAPIEPGSMLIFEIELLGIGGQ